MASEKVPVDDVVVARSSVEIGDSKSTDDGLPTNAGNDVDVAATFLATLDPAILAEPISAKEYRKLLWKIDLTILPLLWVTTIVGAVDKVIISNAAIYGMRTDAHLGGNEFNWVG
jgi:hypothetical protein